MNIFEWVGQVQGQLVEEGQPRLAQLMEVIPSLVTDDEHQMLDALMPEALALARQQGNPWVEVYLRHWNLQSHILHRVEIGPYLSEAVDLLDFAHREENIACPQSTCVTQDLTVAYARRDGEGFVEERLAVAAETLDRITPRWQCFVCISAQYISALMDDGARRRGSGVRHDAAGRHEGDADRCGV